MYRCSRSVLAATLGLLVAISPLAPARASVPTRSARALLAHTAGAADSATRTSATAFSLSQPDDDGELVLEDDDDADEDDSGVETRPALSPAEAEANEKYARELYGQAESLYGAGQIDRAIVKYEAGYRLVPDKHGFAFKIGVAAWEIRDCIKARDMLERFVDVARYESKFADRVPRARSILARIRDTGCADRQADDPAVAVPNTDEAQSEEEFDEPEVSDRRSRREARRERRRAQMADDDENPLGASSRDLRADARRRAELNDKSSRGLLGAGISLMTLGVLGAGTGVVFNIMADGKAKELLSLTARDPRTLYPTGDYGCRNPDEPCPYDIERELRQHNIITPIAYAAGGTVFAVGMILVIVRQAAQRKLGNSKAEADVARRRGPVLDGISPSFSRSSVGASARIRF